MSKDRHGQKWIRNEVILAFELYCRTPYSRIDKNNPEIIELANILGRTPGSVGLKMANLAACDPEVSRKNLKGMRNGAKLDKEIFDEFSTNLGELAYLAKELREQYAEKTKKSYLREEELEYLPEGKYRHYLVKQRVGQEFFRRAVLNAYHNRCCITGIMHSELLIASHIKPWQFSSEENERTNPKNGLCLNAFHDKAFDKGYITIDSNFRIIVSKQLSDIKMDNETKLWINAYKNKTIEKPDRFLPDKIFLEYHNDVVFKG